MQKRRVIGHKHNGIEPTSAGLCGVPACFRVGLGVLYVSLFRAELLEDRKVVCGGRLLSVVLPHDTT